MEAQKVDLFIMTNGKFFESHQIPSLRDRLLQLEESQWLTLQTVEFKDPTTMLIVSLFGGGLGIDRFLLGETGLGVAKLLTCGGASIWTIVDWFLIMGRTRELNMEKFMNAIQ